MKQHISCLKVNFHLLDIKMFIKIFVNMYNKNRNPGLIAKW